uniref:Uncharacterized protein n=1 Tax=Oryza glaberrima TaxID=4538 RepID=I1QJE7_ORYGL
MPPASSAPIASAAVSSAGEPSMVKERLRVLGHLVPGCRKLPAPMLLGPTMWPRWRCRSRPCSHRPLGRHRR